MSHATAQPADPKAEMAVELQCLRLSVDRLTQEGNLLRDEITTLRSLQQKITGSYDPSLTPVHNTSFEFIPNDNFVNLCTFGDSCLLFAPFCLRWPLRRRNTSWLGCMQSKESTTAPFCVQQSCSTETRNPLF